MEEQEIRLEIFAEVLASLHFDPQRFVQKMRLAAAVMWYENGIVSQGPAAEIAGLSRSEFVAPLEGFGVFPFPVSVGELLNEALDE